MPAELDSTLTISYDSKTEVFKAEGEFVYKKGRLDGKVKIGVTNSAVKDGELLDKKGDKFVFYGTGSLGISLIEGKAKVDLVAEVKPGGELFISAKATLNPTKLMETYTKDKKIPFPSLKIPLVGVPFVSIFLEIGGGVKIYFNWDPLTIGGSITLPETDIMKLAKAKFGININASSTAIAGAGMEISASIGAEAAVLQVKGGVSGFAGLEVKAGIGADLNMELDLEKGLVIKDLLAKIEVKPYAKFSLTGVIGVYLNLLFTTIDLWEYKKVLAEGSIDLSSLGGLEVTVPVKFDKTGNLIMPSIEDVQFKKPEFSAEKGKELMNAVFNDKKTEDPAKEEETKQKIRDVISKELRNRLRPDQPARESFDVNKIAADVQNKLANTDKAFSGFIIESTKGELKTIANEVLENLRKQLMVSNEPLPTKLAKVDEYETQWELWRDKTMTPILREELKKQDAGKQTSSVQRKPIFESDEEKNIQKKTEAEPGITNQPEEKESPADSVQKTDINIQTFPQAGYVLPGTNKQRQYYKYSDEVVDIMGQATFQPSEGLGNYIASMWENGQEPAVNIRVGNLGEGFIFVQHGLYLPKMECEEIIDPVYSCTDVPPPTGTYRARKQVIPITHAAFSNRTDGTLVYMVEIINGFIDAKLGWISGIKAEDVDPFMDASTAEEAFLPLIYGKEYDGTNYVSQHFENKTSHGKLFFYTIGVLQLPNQQSMQGWFLISKDRYQFQSELVGKPEGLEQYKAPVIRTPDALLTAETNLLLLDANWTSGKADDEDGLFTASSQIRLSYRNRILELFGTANYKSARFNGEVNITVTTKSKSDKLFAEHAAEIVKTKDKGLGLAPGSPDGANPEEPLALTAWGDLTFRIIDSDNKAMPGTTKPIIDDLQGEAAFVVSSNGFIILGGRVKLPTKWLLTEELKYNSTDPENEDKHLFKDQTTVVDAWVPAAIGSIEVILGIVIDANAGVKPLELYEIEVSGIYSNHPDYRSEVNLTPKFFVSGHAEASVKVHAAGIYKFLGLIKSASITGDVTGTARIDAFIDAAPTISRLWKDGDSKAAVYAVSGILQTGGELTFSLTGSLHLEALGIDLFDSENYHIGTWRLGKFGVELILNEYILGSGQKPKIDYGKMGMNSSQRHWLGQSITEEIKDKGGSEKRIGGFEQKEDGKKIEKGTFSATPPPPRSDHNKDSVENRIEENFLMGHTLHDLVIVIGGTREAPTAILMMASGPEKPLIEKIEAEKDIVELDKLATFDPVDEARIDTQLRDLQGIEGEAVNIEKDAKGTAQAEPVNDPKVAGFDQIDDRISDYARKYNKEDLGVVAPTTTTTPGTTPATPPVPATPSTPGTTPTPAPATPSTTTPAPAATVIDLKKLKVDDILSVPYKNGRARATVLEISKDFVTILINSKSRSGDIRNMIPRARFKTMLDDHEIFIWSELRTYLMNNRPKYVAGLVEQVWENAIQADGKVRDPNPLYEELTWHRNKSRFDQWHMGHKPKYKYSRLVDRLVNEEIDWDQFIEDYNNPDNYNPELPSKNMGHGFESEPE
jgi:polyhydroxyalkanoate synthesis regulator phasin